MDSAPATSPAMPASCITCKLSAPAPTPSISEAVLTRPSLAPSTKARSQGARWLQNTQRRRRDRQSQTVSTVEAGCEALCAACVAAAGSPQPITDTSNHLAGECRQCSAAIRLHSTFTATLQQQTVLFSTLAAAAATGIDPGCQGLPVVYMLVVVTAAAGHRCVGWQLLVTLLWCFHV
jgi:hypothetical protein